MRSSKEKRSQGEKRTRREEDNERRGQGEKERRSKEPKEGIGHRLEGGLERKDK